MPRRRLFDSLPLVLALLFQAFPAAAQSTFLGTVRDDATRMPLVGVEILIEGTTLRTTTSASGHYRLSNVPSGNQVVLVRLVGYLPQREQLLFPVNDSTSHDVLLVRQAAQVLDSVEVTGRVTRGVGIGREAFEERRERGFGKFIDTEELRRSEHRRLPDLLRGVPGIRMIRYQEGCDPICRGGIEVRAAHDRGATSILRQPGVRNPTCYMSVMLDGRWLYTTDSNMKVPDFNRDFSISDLDMVEVYRSAGEVPGEYSGASAACGVIVLWSRRAP